MSARALSAFGAAAKPAHAEPKAAERARAVADSRPRLFFITRRVNLRFLPRWKRFVYKFFCRILPAEWRVPPAPPMWRGGFLTFDEAVESCQTPDDQLHALPLGWAYGGDEIDADEVCRPLDETDQERFSTLKEKYGGGTDARPAFVNSVEVREALDALPPTTRYEVEQLLKNLSRLAKPCNE